jgi:hypothetical protein
VREVRTVIPLNIFDLHWVKYVQCSNYNKVFGFLKGNTYSNYIMCLAFFEGSTDSDYINKNMVQKVNEEGGSIPAVVIITNTNFVYRLTKRITRPGGKTFFFLCFRFS